MARHGMAWGYSRTWNDGRDQSSAAAAVREITVPTLSFNHLIEEYHLNLAEAPAAGSAGSAGAAAGAAVQSIPFFKIDCEGCEYSVIPSFTDEQWDKIIVRKPKHSTAQHSTALLPPQHSTAQHSTAQHSTGLGSGFTRVFVLLFVCGCVCCRRPTVSCTHMQ
jgi:hypothetical protein